MNGQGGTCILCGEGYDGWGHNPEPLVEYDRGRCCGVCNDTQVMPARIDRIIGNHPSNGRDN